MSRGQRPRTRLSLSWSFKCRPKLRAPIWRNLGSRVEFAIEGSLGRANQMARVEAGANEAMVILYRRQDYFGRVPAMEPIVAGRTVRMNADADVELGDQLVQAVEAVRIGIGAEVADAEFRPNSNNRRLAAASLVKRSTPNATGVMLCFISKFFTALICASVLLIGTCWRKSSTFLTPRSAVRCSTAPG